MANTTGTNKAASNSSDREMSIEIMKKKKKKKQKQIMELSGEEDVEEKGEEKIRITTWRMI